MQEKRFSNGSPVLLGNENRITLFAGDLNRFVGFSYLIDERIEISPGFGGSDGRHDGIACVKASGCQVCAFQS